MDAEKPLETWGGFHLPFIGTFTLDVYWNEGIINVKNTIIGWAFG